MTDWKTFMQRYEHEREIKQLRTEKEAWHRAWQKQWEATGKAWWQGFRHGQKTAKPAEDPIALRGRMLNEEASISARLLTLKDDLDRAEKDKRKGSELLNRLRAEQEEKTARHIELRAKLTTMKAWG